MITIRIDLHNIRTIYSVDLDVTRAKIQFSNINLLSYRQPGDQLSGHPTLRSSLQFAETLLKYFVHLLTET